MANLNVKRLAEEEAEFLRAAARTRGETMREFVLAAGRLLADLEWSTARLLSRGDAVPACPAVRVGELSLPEAERHARACPICRAASMHRAGIRAEGGAGWTDLSADTGVPLFHLVDRIGRLPERERDVVREAYGLADGRRKSYEEIGAALGVTRERIRQLADRAKAALTAGTPAPPTAGTPGGRRPRGTRARA